MRQVVAYKHTGVATTRTTYDDGSIEIPYHSTVVARRTAEGAVILNAGGWRTPTTKKRINAALDEWAFGWRVYQKDFQWYLSSNIYEARIYFENGMKLRRDGTEWVVTLKDGELRA